MSGTDLRELLRNRAGDAPTPPADLIERVRAGHRRRRRGQMVLAAFAAILVLAVGGWTGLNSVHRPTTLPANPLDLPRFRLPRTLDAAPGIASAFPGSVLDGIPATAPSDLNTVVYGRLGPGHALVGDRKTLYDYDTGARTFRTITEAGPAMTAVALAPHWIVWQQSDSTNAGHFRVYKAPRSGGARQLVADVPQAPSSTTWYATDENVYWTSRPPNPVGVGVTRLSLKDGAVTEMAGFEDLTVDGTPWAKDYKGLVVDVQRLGKQDESRITVMRNVVTGEQRPVTTRDDTDWLRCVASFCLGQTRSLRPSPTTASGVSYAHQDGYFLQHPDGSDRVELPYRTVSPELLKTDDGGLVVFHTLTPTVLDPVSGKVGTIPGAGKRLRCYGMTVGGVEWSNETDPGRLDCHPSVHYAIFD
jgi:hypothetical protein